MSDLRYAIRTLLKTPGFTIVAVLTLALGIGATTAIFSVVHAVVLRPLPYRAPDELLRVRATLANQPSAVSPGLALELEHASSAIDGLAVSRNSSFSLAGPDGAQRLVGMRVNGNYFRTLGVDAQLGRVLVADDDRAEAAAVAVLSHRLWESTFGGDTSIVGRDIRLDGRVYRIVGVMPPSFSVTADGPELWVPLAFSPTERATLDSHYLDVLVRPRRGVTREAAEAHLQSIGERMQREHPRELKGSTIRLEPYMDAFVGGYRMRLTIVLGAVALVLLIGCGNVAHLMLARATAKGREVAIRTALGAGRVQLVRQFAAEGVVLAALAAVGGLLFAAWAIRALVALSPPGVPRIEQTRLDFTVMSFALAIAVFSTVLAALAPTIRTIRRDMTSALKAGGRGVSGGRDLLRSTLIAAEVALTLVLLAGAGLLIRSAIETARVPLGFDPNGLLSARVSLPSGASRNDEQIRLAFQQMVDETGRIAGVESAALVSQAPLGPGGNSNGVVPEGRPLEVGSAIISQLRLVTSEYFRTARVTVMRGRQFDGTDRRGTLRVVIVSESLARQAFPNQDAVGKRIACCEAGPDGMPAWWTIIGVAQDVHSSGPGEAPSPEFYIAAAQAPSGSWDWVQRTVYLVARTSGDTSALAAPIRAAVASVSPDAPVFDVQPMRSRLASSIATERFNTFLLTLLSAVGLIFAAVGVYGVVSYSVGRRTQEVGVRMALGATRSDVLTMVLSQAAKPIVTGVALGLIGSLAATRLLSEQLVGVTPTDPVTFGSVIALLVAVALGAILIPARRASRMEPTIALRYE